MPVDQPPKVSMTRPIPNLTAEERNKKLVQASMDYIDEKVAEATRKAFEEAAVMAKRESEKWAEEMKLCDNKLDEDACHERRLEAARLSGLIRALAKENPTEGGVQVRETTAASSAPAGTAEDEQLPLFE